MAKAPYITLGSQDILSAHLNGIQYGINSIETVLGMGTAVKTAHRLQAVTDMDDPSLRYRIYEATDRNWLLVPTPVIYRDGVLVPTDEYEVQPAYGVVIFTIQQNSGAVIRADFTHVTGTSSRIESLEQHVIDTSGHEDRLGTAEGNIGTLQATTSDLGGRVTTLEAEAVGATGELTLEAVDLPLNPNAKWLGNFKNGKDLYDSTYYEPVLVGAGTIDLFPFYVPYEAEYDAMRVVVASSNSVSATMRMGIYSNKGVKPQSLLAQTAVFTASTGGTYDKPLTTDGTGTPLVNGRITLKSGLYWIGRYHSAGISLRGNGDNNNIITISNPADTSIINGAGGYAIGGVRCSGVSSLVATVGAFSSGSVAYLSRSSYGISWVRRATGY